MRATLLAAMAAVVASAVGAAALTPTPTPGATSCVGDCDGSGAVDVGEVIRCVGMAVGSGSEPCARCDSNGDTEVSVNEIVAAVSSLLGGCVGRDAYEPDNSQSAANPIVCGELQIHDLSRPGDDDWVRIDLPPRIAATITTEAVTDDYWDTTLTLYSAGGEQLAVGDYGFGDELSRLEFGCPAPGVPSTYFARVGQYADDEQGVYGIRLSCYSCPTPQPTATLTPVVVPDVFEPDNAIDQASRIGCGEVQRHSATVGDTDWLSLSVPTRSTVHVRVVADPNYLDVGVHDRDGALVPAGYDGNFECGRNALPAGEYHVRVQALFRTVSAAYDVAVLCEPCALDDGTPTPTQTPYPTPRVAPTDVYEPDTRDGALSLGCGEGAIRSLAPRGDNDWFQLQIPGRQAVRILTYGAGNAQLALQDASGRDIAFGNGHLERRCGEAPLDGGTYFVEAYGGSSSSFEYDLWVICEPCAEPGPPTAAVSTRTPTQLPLPNDAYEPDDSAGAAGAIACGELQTHSLHSSFDEDWVAFELRDSAFSISLASYDFALLDAATGSLISSGYRVLSLSCAEARSHSGRYLIRGPQFAGPIASYDLGLACAPCEPTPTSTPTPSVTFTRTRFPTRTPGGPDQITRVFTIEPGSLLASATQPGSGWFTTAVEGRSVSHGPDPGPLVLALGQPNPEGIATLHLKEDVTLRFALLDESYICLQLFAADSDGRIDCDGGTAFNTLATQAAAEQGVLFEIDTGLGLPRGPGHGDLLVSARYRVVERYDTDFGEPCADVAYPNPLQTFAFTTATARANKGGLQMKADGAPFDCDGFVSPCSGGALAAPIPGNQDPVGAVAHVVRLTADSAACDAARAR